MVSLQSALLPEARKRPPCLSFADASVVASTATSKKRKRDGEVEEDEEEEDGIELNFDAAPLPLEWQRCLDIKSGQIHYYNTRTHKRTSKDPRRQGGAVAAVEEDVANCGPQGLDLDLNLAFEPRRRSPVKEEKRAEAKPAAATGGDHHGDQAPASASGGMEMVAAVCMRCHMLVMMCRACPACPNCKFLHPTSRPTPPAPLKLGLQLLCCRD
ncbi:hypothetical protein D1007_36399 [Hordeum vulgare]|uniref:WW domain-containing protein n=1 Tax=Hordeum vulgare subsp. vulgare TaxID=112509 RepID=A0A8I7BD67_HORVV|nr:uncharacterized protein LOC123447189 [Hordeum vulgare subsp. vulgare]KAE8789417.1 hypothetical protein D1007_36399 [Hordeum vulgare]KAI4994989.1 hypothetical protein ZWY2020_034892 [Hordeum vulgare]